MACNGNCGSCGGHTSKKTVAMSEPKKALVKRLLTLQDATASSRRALEAVFASLSGSFIPEKELEEIKTQTISSLEGLIEFLVPVFDNYTEEELQAMIDFGESPIGRAIAAKSPAIQAESYQLSMQYAQQVFADVTATFEDRFGREQQFGRA